MIFKPLASTLISLSILATPMLAGADDRNPVTYNSVDLDEVTIFYRDAGPKDGQVILLLHGFPSSSHMFRDLIPELASDYRVIAPDYPGFGQSSAPDAAAYDYDFATLAETMNAFVKALGLSEYTLYVQDYGGPVGMRMIQNHPERLNGIIVQNATFHVEGWNPEIVEQFGPFWTNRTGETEEPLRQFLTPQTTEWMYRHGSTRAERLSPDAWTHDQAGMIRPGNDAIQMEYLWNYQDNVANYDAWQAQLAELQPDTLIVWGKNDPIFTMAGVQSLQTLLPKADAHFYDAGHFALETHAQEISGEILKFMNR